MQIRSRDLDGLRALAVLSVVWYHAHASLLLATALDRQGILTASIGDRLLYAGRHGVDLFFVLSGLCLSLPVLRVRAAGLDAHLDVPAFFAKRVIRIVPPYWIAAVAFMLLTATLVLAHVPLPPTILAVHWPQLIGQLFFFDAGTEFSNGSFWSLCIELRWYLLFPVCLWLWITRPRCFWLVMAGAYVLYHVTRWNVIDVATLPAFMLGIVAAELRVRSPKAARYILIALPVVLAWALATDGHTLQDAISWQIAAFTLVVAVGAFPGLARVLSVAPLAFIGVTSYSIYLYHEPIEQLLIVQGGINWAVVAIGSIAVGIVAWWVIERRTLMPSLRDPAVARLATFFRSAGDWLLQARPFQSQRSAPKQLDAQYVENDLQARYDLRT